MKRITTNLAVGACIALAGLVTTNGQQPRSASKQVNIVDQNLQMAAYTLTIPADWRFDGTFLPGPSCAPLAIPIYRAIGPDGIAEVKLLPGISWSWGGTPQSFDPKAAKPHDCLEWNKEVPAADFIKYMTGVLQVDYIQALPIPDPEMARFQDRIRQLNQNFASQTPNWQPRPITVKADRASAKVRYSLNGKRVEEALTATVFCSNTPQALIPRGWGTILTCTGNLIRMRAPEGQLDAMLPAMNAIWNSPVVNQQWMRRWNEAVQHGGEEVRRMGRAREAMLLKQNADWNEATRRGTDAALDWGRQQMNSRSKVKDDWCDYALDCTRYSDGSVSETCPNRQTAP